MKNSLRLRLVFSYILVASLCIFMISLLSNIFIKRQFKDYIIQEQRHKSEEIVTAITNQYKGSYGWNEGVVNHIGTDALQDGLIISIKDNSGNFIWDAATRNPNEYNEIISKFAEDMLKIYPNWKGEYEVNKFPIIIDSTDIAVVEIGYYGPFHYSDYDIIFLNTLNKIFFITGATALCLATILGAFMSKTLSYPLLSIIAMTGKISKGNYKSRIKSRSKIGEINKLETTINNLAKDLENQESLRKRLTGDIAHELRTPIATLQSHLEAIIDGVWEPTNDRIKSCHEETIRLYHLVGDLEKLAQYESDNLILNKSSFNIGEVINNVVLNFEKRYIDKGVELNFHDTNKIVYADRDKIIQVIVNLLSNALKYTPSGGKVDIEIKENKEYVLIYIKDNGQGIPNEDVPFIFERFYRADKSRNRLTGGGGIGLTICKAIIEAHQGQIEVKSTLNEGTLFEVCLPTN